jgi:hypothetical protein
MLGAIVLRDIPKEETRIDLTRYPIQGGFRGFSGVPPKLWHYVSVKVRDHHVGFWCYHAPQQAVVKVFDYETGFEDADPGTQAQYSRLALSGAMGPALIPYPINHLSSWITLVQHIPAADSLPRVHAEDAGAGSRFDKALLGTHGGDGKSLLGEFQTAFVRWLVSMDTAAQDEAAFARWRHLVLSAYNAGESRIGESGDLFPQLVDLLLRQFDLLPNDWFGPDSFLASSQASYMAEDMIDTGVEEIAEKGQVFADYLKKRAA